MTLPASTSTTSFCTYDRIALTKRTVSKPFPSTSAPIHQSPAHPLPGDKFPSPLFLNYAQALASSLSALSYLLFSAWRSGALRRDGLWAVLGVNTLLGAKGETRAGGRTEVLAGATGKSTAKGTAGEVEKDTSKSKSRSESESESSSPSSEQVVQGNGAAGKTKQGSTVTVGEPTPKRSLLFLLVQVSVFQTMAGPIGFLALRHISYPTMVLGKVCSSSSPQLVISSSRHLLVSPSPLLRTLVLPRFDVETSSRTSVLPFEHIDSFPVHLSIRWARLTPADSYSLASSSP